MSRIKIYNTSDVEVFDVLLNENCEHTEELMKRDDITLSFVYGSLVRLPQGSYIRVNNERYTLADPYTPDQTDDKRFKYEPVFKSRAMLWDRQPFFWYTFSAQNVIQSKEFDWSLTARPVDFLVAVCNSILYETGEIWHANIADNIVNKYVDLTFSNVTIMSGLNMIAEAFETEWHADLKSNTIYFGKAQFDADLTGYYDDLTLEVSKNINHPNVQNTRDKYYTRFYAYGSSRNITQDYNGAATNSSVTKHLTLDPDIYPQGYKDISGHFDAVTGEFVSDLARGEVFPISIVFEGIYPRSALSISNVRSRLMYRLDEDGNKIQIGEDEQHNPIYETYAIWYFQIANFNMSTDLIIAGLTLSVHFNSGNLLDREFELAWHEHAETVDSVSGNFNILAGDYEIIFVEQNGAIIPAKQYLVPTNGDSVTLFNIKMPAEYVKSSQAELADTLDVEIAKMLLDLNNYTFNSNAVQFKKDSLILHVGQAVTYKNRAYSYDTRVLSVKTNLAIPYKQEIKIGEDRIAGSTTTLREEVKLVTDALGQLTYVVNSNSAGALTSAKARRMFLRKDADDTAAGAITFEKQSRHIQGAQFGQNFVAGIVGGIGGRITGDADAELKSLILREFLEVPELRYNRTDIEVGNSWTTFGAGIIESVTIDEDEEGNLLNTGTIKLKLEDGEYGAIAEDDLCMGIFHSEIAADNSSDDYDDGRGNFRFAGFYTSYFRITEITDTVHNSEFKYVLRAVSTRHPYPKHPHAFMTFACYANPTNTSRQKCKFNTKTYTRYLINQTSWEWDVNNIAMQTGDLSNLSIFGLDMTGYSAYLNNIYLTGRIEQIVNSRYYMQIDSGGDNFMGDGETKTLVCKVYNGYNEDVTSQVTHWTVTRESGNTGADAVWNNAHTDFAGTLVITEADLAAAILSTQFNFTATNEQGNTATGSVTVDPSEYNN